MEVVLEMSADFVELPVNLRHCGLEGLKVLVLLGLGSLVERVRSTDSGNHILALGVDEPLAVELVVAVCRVAGECHTCCRGVTHISEYHGLDIDSCSPVIRNFLDLSVCDGALSVPGLEYATDGAPELSLCSVRKIYSENFLYLGLEELAKVFELVCGNVGVGLVALLLLELGHHPVKLLTDALAVFWLDTLGLLHDNVGVHHDEAAVCIVNEAWIAGLLDHSRKGGRAESDVEDGVHHSRHGTSRAGTAADEKRVGRISEFLAHDLLSGCEGLCNFLFELVSVAAAESIVLGTAFCGNGESCRNRHSEKVHLSEIRALASEEFTHGTVTFSRLASETVHSFLIFQHIFLFKLIYF